MPKLNMFEAADARVPLDRRHWTSFSSYELVPINVSMRDVTPSRKNTAATSDESCPTTIRGGGELRWIDDDRRPRNRVVLRSCGMIGPPLACTFAGAEPALGPVIDSFERAVRLSLADQLFFAE
jgi:hypothetical protein